MTEEAKQNETTDAQRADLLRVQAKELIVKLSAVFDGYKLTSIALALVSIINTDEDLSQAFFRLQLLCQCPNCRALRAQA